MAIVSTLQIFGAVYQGTHAEFLADTRIWPPYTTLYAKDRKQYKAGNGNDTYANLPFSSLLPSKNVGEFYPMDTMTDPLDGYICDGREVSRNVDSSLFAKIGTKYGAGNGVDTFNLPDLRHTMVGGVSSEDEPFPYINIIIVK